MFKEYHIEWDTVYELYCVQIIDTDFGAVAFSVAPVNWVSDVATVIIDCYTKRGLPVAPNLIRYMLLLRDKYGWSLDFQVKWNEAYNTRWHEVEDDMKMYLLLS